MSKSRLRILIIFSTLLFFNTTLAGAHGLATEKNEVVGQYMPQLEYDTVGDLYAGDVNTYGFELHKPNSEESLDFDRVFVSVTKKDGPSVFVANIYPTEVLGIMAGRARFSIPVAGTYDFELQYFKGDNKLIDHTFTMPVSPPYTSGAGMSETLRKYLWVITLVVGFLLGIIIKKKRA